jgi:hypothetical protein
VPNNAVIYAAIAALAAVEVVDEIRQRRRRAARWLVERWIRLEHEDARRARLTEIAVLATRLRPPRAGRTGGSAS